MDKGKRATIAVIVAVICLAIGNGMLHAPVAMVYLVAVLAGGVTWMLTAPRSSSS